jgi:hypothetical protein
LKVAQVLDASVEGQASSQTHPCCQYLAISGNQLTISGKNCMIVAVITAILRSGNGQSYEFSRRQMNISLADEN